MPSSQLQRVDPAAPRGGVYRLLAGIAGSRLVTRISTTRIWAAVVWPIDRVLLRVTGGRLRTGLLIPMALLETRGARSGEARRTAVIYFHDGDDVTIVASKAGLPGNPSWFHNARANPDVTLGGEPFRATVVEGEEERDRLWGLADNVFPGFRSYRQSATRVGRTIPIVRLSPKRDADV